MQRTATFETFTLAEPLPWETVHETPAGTPAIEML
jgi:hypothetical protein